MGVKVLVKLQSHVLLHFGVYGKHPFVAPKGKHAQLFGGVSDVVHAQCTHSAYTGVVAWTISANLEASAVGAYAFA